MAEEELKISISTDFKEDGAKKASSSLKDIEKQSETTYKTLDKFRKIDFFAHLTQGIVNASAIIGKLGSAFRGVFSVFSDGIKLNSQFEQINTKLQSLIFTADKSSNIDPFAKWQNSGNIASAVMDELKGLSNKVGFSQFDLGEMFSGFFSTASSHLNMDQAIAVFEKLAYTAKVSGVDINTLKVTLDNVGAGIIQTNNDFGRFLNSLGLGTEELKNAIANGNYAELLINSLAPFEEASNMAGKSFEQIKQEFDSNIKEIKQIVSEPIFKALGDGLDELNKGENLKEIQDALRGLGEEFGKLLKENLTSENIQAAASAISALVQALAMLVQGVKTLGDVAVPDWLFGKENAGWSDLATNFTKGMSELKDLFIDWSGDDEIAKFSDRIRMAKLDVKEELDKLGAVFEGAEFKGFNKDINLSGLDKAISSVRKKYNELFKIEKEIDGLTTFNKLEVKYNDEFMGKFNAELTETYKLLLQLQNYDGIEALIQDDQNAQALNARLEAVANANKGMLNEWLNANEQRAKDYEKTINSLMREEEKLTSKLESEIAKRDNIKANANSQRDSISFDYDEKIRTAGYDKLADYGKFNSDMQAFKNAIEEANKALASGDLSTYERALELAKSINEQWKANEVIGASNSVADYQSRLEQLKQTELSGIDAREQKDLEAHQQKIDQINAEIEAIRQKAQAETEFVNTFKELKDLQVSGKIDFSEEGFSAVREKINAVQDQASNIKGAVNIDASNAISVIEKLKQPTNSTHTVHIKEVRSEAKASGGIIGAFKRKRGKIPGHDMRGSDDVPALLTRGEFVQNVRAVDYYGESFMNALNSLKIPRTALPRFNTGGLVGGYKPLLNTNLMSFKSGGSVKKPSEKNVNLNFILKNGESYKTLTDEESAEAIERYLRGLV